MQSSMPSREARGADLADTWDSRVWKLLNQFTSSAPSSVVSESERAVPGEVAPVVDRARPFFDIAAKLERERKTRAEAPDASARVVVQRPAPESQTSAFQAFASSTTSPATLSRYFDALRGSSACGAWEYDTALDQSDDRASVSFTARSSDIHLVVSATASPGRPLDFFFETLSTRVSFRRLCDSALDAGRGTSYPLREFLSVAEASLEESATDAYVRALCRYEPREVRPFLQECTVGYRLKSALRRCEYYGALEARALILEKMGRAGEALSACIVAYAVHLKSWKGDLGDDESEAKTFKSRADDVVATAVGVCFRGGKIDPKNKDKKCLWTKLSKGLVASFKRNAKSADVFVRGVVETHLRAVLRAASALESNVLVSFAEKMLRESFKDEAALRGFRNPASRILESTRLKASTAEGARRRARAREQAAGDARRKRGNAHRN